MSLIKYEPLNMLSRMQNELNAFFHRRDSDFPSLFDDTQTLLGSEWMPRIDIKEDDTNFIIIADVPVVEPKDIKVTMENGMLSIRGERKSEKEEKKKNYHRKECVMGSFERYFRMPDTADSSQVSAKGKNGVLTIKIGKKVGTKPKTIKIDSE
jgi:HSP20 family protein